MSLQITQTTIDLVHKLDDIPARPFHTIMPFQDYGEQDINDAADLISKMIKWVPKERISCKEALKHKFFKDMWAMNVPIHLINDCMMLNIR